MNAQFTNIELSRLNALIERSIDSHNPTIDLGLYFEICDLINNREDNAKEAFKALKRELNIYKGKNWFVVLKILALLEVCANNCSKKFQINLINKEFLGELKLMLSPKLQPPIEIQEKILFLIQYWANMFKADSDFKPIESLYGELRGKGVDFPINNPDITTLANQLSAKNVNVGQTRPQVSTAHALPDVQRLNLQDTHAHSHQNPHQQQHNPAPAISVVKLNEEQTAKLNSELDVVETNVHILNEILNEFQSTPKVDDSKSDDLNLLQDLVKTCREMQKRITQLIGSISNENIINELLRINDDLNNSFLRYERFERSLNLQQKKSSPGIVVEPRTAGAASAKSVEEKPLIDFDDVDPKLIRSQKLENSKQSPPVGGFNQAAAKSQNSADKTDIGDENEIKEMEDWLRQQGANENYQNENETSQKL